MAKRVAASVVWVACAAVIVPSGAFAFGPPGHEIAGMLAEPRLCAAARSEVARLGRGESLAQLGLWADSARDSPQWRDSAPWHYVNVADPPDHTRAAALAAIRGVVHPREGDVLEAIERFEAVLHDRTRSRGERADALRFVVHFVVDVHQPLHVGRAADRGGNTVDVRHGGEVVNLHRFWDTDALEERGESVERRARRLRAALAALPAERAHEPVEVWAAESLELRGTVYAFGRANTRGGGAIELDDGYLAAASHALDGRLALAAARLAAALNALFCAAPR